MKLLPKLIICTIALCLHLQTKAQFTWNFTAATATGTVTNLTAGSVTRVNNNTANPTFLAAGIPASTGYTGASAGFNGNCSANIGVVNTTTSTYVQVVLTPTANFWVNISAIKWGNYFISTTGPATLSIYTSLDNYTTSVATVASGTASTWNLLNPTFTSINGITSTAVTIRIYASGGTTGTPAAGTANWRIDDLVITASAQSGVAGNIPKYTSPTTFANSIMAEVNNNIGVGTITPTYKFEVAGNLKTTLDANINGLIVGKGLNNDVYSTAVGFDALNITTTGTKNTFMGWKAGSSITSGQLNTGVGFGALYSAAGSGNTALGSYAMQYWLSGFYNIGIGYDVMHGTSPTNGGTGQGNIGIGRKVMGAADVSGSYNVGLGYLSLLNLTSGSNNIAIGPNAGNTLTTGSSNILLGSVNASSTTASNELNIGNWIYGTNGSIGIGTTTPQNKFEITHGTAGNSGLRFTNLTSSSTAAVSSGKVLSVDANGDVVLELAGGGAVPDGSETKIVSGSPNVTVSGNGTIPAPYSIAVTNPASYWDASTLGTNNIVNNNAGGVIIGTPAGISNLSTGYKLYVTDGIITEKVKVRLKTNWPDYVFEKDYKLLSLNETENFIKLNNHLPGVQSTEDVKKEGIELGETNALLLKKIEELTLYLIAADKEIKELQKKVNKLDRKN